METMTFHTTIRFALTLISIIAISCDQTTEKTVRDLAEPEKNIIVNGVRLSEDTLRVLEQRYGIRILEGAYWYDNVSGAYGLQAGPTIGFSLPGLKLGGSLRANASGGGTDVFVNGRELHPLDVSALQQILGQIFPGRYWLDAQGNFGYEGGPALGNLIFLVHEAGGGGDAYIRETYSGYIGSDGDTSYFFDPETGCSVMSGAGVSC